MEVWQIFVQNTFDTVYEIQPNVGTHPNVGSKAAAYTDVALSLLTWRIWWAARNASNFRVYYLVSGDRGSTVVKVLCYISECHWFDPRWCHSNLSLTLNPSVRTMALRSTQPLTEISTRSISVGDKRGRCVRLKTLPPSCAVVMKSGNRNFLEPSGPLQACKGTVLPLLGFTFSWLVSLTVHAASEILALSVILCEVLSSSSGVPRNLFREEFNKFICGQRIDFYLYLYTLYFAKKDAIRVLCLFHLDVSCGEMLGLIQSQVFPWVGCFITRLLINFWWEFDASNK